VTHSLLIKNVLWQQVSLGNNEQVTVREDVESEIGGEPSRNGLDNSEEAGNIPNPRGREIVSRSEKLKRKWRVMTLFQ